MPTRLTSALLLSLALTTSACSSSMNTPDIKQNSHPRQRYELTVTIAAPGPFEKVSAGTGYKISNVECLPYQSFVGVHSPMPRAGQDMVLRRESDTTWKGYFYLDQMQDEDYFALGVCHWQLESIGAGFIVHDQSFDAALMLDDVLRRKSATRYFRKKTYFNQSMTNSNAGSADSWRATDEDVVRDPAAFFPVTVAVKEAKP